MNNSTNKLQDARAFCKKNLGYLETLATRTPGEAGKQWEAVREYTAGQCTRAQQIGIGNLLQKANNAQKNQLIDEINEMDAYFTNTLESQYNLQEEAEAVLQQNQLSLGGRRKARKSRRKSRKVRKSRRSRR